MIFLCPYHPYLPNTFFFCIASKANVGKIFLDEVVSLEPQLNFNETYQHIFLHDACIDGIPMYSLIFGF